MDATDMQGPAHIPQDLFRPSKRRKFYRKRADTEDDPTSDAAPLPPIATPELQTVDELIFQSGASRRTDDVAESEGPISVADLIRQRKAIQRRRGGIEFTNLHSAASALSTGNSNQALVEKHDETPADIKSVIERFAPQTGQVSEATDKHMYGLPPLP